MEPAAAPIKAPWPPLPLPELFPIMAPAMAPRTPPATAPSWVLGPVPTQPTTSKAQLRGKIKIIFDFIIKKEKKIFNNIQEHLFNDIQKYRNVKPFKSAKRLWSLSKIRHDVETLNKLEYLINSSVSILSQINADIETLQLLINKNINYDKNYILIEIDTFIDRITRIIDIDLNEDEIIKMIRDIKTSFIKS